MKTALDTIVRGNHTHSTPVAGPVPGKCRAQWFALRAAALALAGGLTGAFAQSVPTIQNQLPYVRTNQVTLRGAITASNALPATTAVYWGTSDAGTVAANWQNTTNLGVTGQTSVAAILTSLTANTRYYYRFFATNSAGGVWAPSSTEFTMVGAAPYGVITFFSGSDSHYGYSGTDGTCAPIADGALDRMNSLPGQDFPASVGGVVGVPRGVVVIGDLTESDKAADWTEFTNHWGLNGECWLSYPLYEGYGNHDGATGPVANGIKARNPLRTGVQPSNISTNGFHYSWDWDFLHVVMLNLFPGDTVDDGYPGGNPEMALQFLTNDLARNVGASGRPVIILHHYGYDPGMGATWWSPAQRTNLFHAVGFYNIIAFLSGHNHAVTYTSWNGFDCYTDGTLGKFTGNFFALRVTATNLVAVERSPNDTWNTIYTKTITMVPPPAQVSNGGGASPIGATSATLNGGLVGTNASPTSIYIYWGATDGGTNRASWANVESLGLQELGAFSRTVSNLTAGATYYYRCLGSNALGSSWAVWSAAFTTLPAAILNNTNGASQVRMTSATLNGNLTYAAVSPTDVYVFWGQTDGGTSKAAWANIVALGPQSVAAFAAALSGLTGQTTYYYRAYASNTIGQAWSDASSSFTTQPAVAVDNQPGPTSVTFTSATLNGNLLITNATPTYVSVFWGPADGDTVKTAWAHEIDLGARPLGAFGANVTGLTIESPYFYRCYASNAVGEAWASATWAFTSAKDFSAWADKLQIALTGYTRNETLQDFPALVVLSPAITNFSYSQFASAAGADLRFADVNDNELSYEVDKWNPSGSSYLWVKVPFLTPSNTVIKAYWGNAAATTPPAYTTNGAVWTANYAGVWHMGQANSLDSTSNKWNGVATQGSNPAYTVTNGPVGDALVCPGNGSYITVGDIDIKTNLTMEAYYLTASNAPVTKYAISKASSYQMDQENVDWLWFWVYGSNWTYNFQLNQGLIWAGNWHYVVMTYDGVNGIQNSYVDGSLWGSYTNGFNPITLNNSPVLLADNYSGSFDEVRISSVCRSSNWQYACWMTMVNNSAFASYTMLATNLPPPTTQVQNTAGASNVTTTGATLNGNLVSVNASPTYVWFYWGTTDGGTNIAAWANQVALGPTSLGAFSTDLTGLTLATTYYYRCCASNRATVAWSPGSASFTTLSGQPLVLNAAPSGLELYSATLNGSLVSTGSAPTTVWVYWGASDGGTDKANWPSVVGFGQQVPGALASTVNALTYNTTYYYRYYASNSYGDSWAAPAASFTTLNPLPVVTNLAASSVTITSVVLNGQLVSTGAAPAYVQVYWGTNDGATVKANWNSVTSLGQQPAGTLSASVAGLANSTAYYYRYYASNSYGEAWAGPAASFLTPSRGGITATGTWAATNATPATADWQSSPVVSGETPIAWTPSIPGNSSTYDLANLTVIPYTGTTAGDLNVDPDGSGNTNGMLNLNTLNLALAGTCNLCLGVPSGDPGNSGGSIRRTIAWGSSGASTALMSFTNSSGTGVRNWFYANTILDTDLEVQLRYRGDKDGHFGGIVSGSGKLTINYAKNPGSYTPAATSVLSIGTAGDAASTHTGGTRLVNTDASTGSYFTGPSTLFTWKPAKANAFGSGLLELNKVKLDLAGFSQTVGGLGDGAGSSIITNSSSTAATLTLSNAAAAAYSGLIVSANIAVVKNGLGVQTLSGANTYSGGTTIKGGTLLVNNTAGSGTGTGSVTVQSGGKLGGPGSVGGAVTVQSGGSVYPSAASGTAATNTINADLSLQTGATCTFRLSSVAGGANDKILVNGNLLATNISISITNSGGLDTSADYVLMAWTGSSTPSFSATPSWLGTVPGDSWTVITGPNQVVLHYNQWFSFTQSWYDPQANGLVLQWQSFAGKSYTLRETTNLLNPVWQAVISNLNATPPLNLYTTPPSGSKRMFYRLSTP